VGGEVELCSLWLLWLGFLKKDDLTVILLYIIINSFCFNYSQVQKRLDTAEKRADFLIKSHMHEEMVAGLRERKNICEDTIKVIEETFDNLNKCT